MVDVFAPERGEVLFDTVAAALAAVRAGRPVVVLDDENRENEGDLVFAAELATPKLLHFTIRHTSGFVCAALPGAELDRLDLPPMTSVNQDPHGTAYAVTVDAKNGVTTGISARDRARTIQLLADPATVPADLSRPGHVVPLRAVAGGVLQRGGHTEAAVDLARLAGLRPAGALCELVNDDGTMMRGPECRRFADEHGLAMISIADLVAYRRRTETQVERAAATRMPTAFGMFRAIGYRSVLDGREHVALVFGDLGDGEDVLVRVHSECLTGDVFTSLRCDCGTQLQASLQTVARAGRGVVVYVRGHEGRGIGLLDKLRAYELQDAGADTVDANLQLGFPADARDYSACAHILADLGVRSMRLLTNNPAKLAGLAGYGLSVLDRVPLEIPATVDNVAYLRTKRDRMGHTLRLGEMCV
ncbi:bifunctional 3,4-dihydroxy-2-butanone-4-phosphate synthase/GTP cyclohydrolase II [Amycolatopsis sp. Poz14]|uniref:bifunctional 3,4-dihydroxy-2-butanone-4-phosphate synthase/GTP cyclohydrolase II n=1 Tax=Amycolatopsis sp. Poz14 TaxID=1447705 RepID=UPI001EE92C92|nr:bifunctional 3,4-dihydroxy-2-butanone-4-phosphate synthase/GTP cyclohydrolase II [Amycolatopsis sp. Poz14]MCG3754032.1 bifunctional 3,4-dihydroxy-2-butanone-4-phosphate synthase/GTP cyclohydrolase II [Amycolatopsis sp. Poz14]